MEVIVPDIAKLPSGSGFVDSKSFGTFSSMQKQEGHRGLFVDRGVGSPRLLKSASAATLAVDLKHDSECKVRANTLLNLKNVEIYNSQRPYTSNYLYCVSRTLCQLLQEQLQLEL